MFQPMSSGQSQELSELAQAVLARPRKTYEFDIGPYVGLGERVGTIAVRVPTKREQDLALVGAHEYIAKLADKNDRIKDDPEILLDTKAAFIVATACRRASNPDKMPAWPSGGFIHEHLTADQIAVCLNIVNQVRAKDSPTPTAIDSQIVDALSVRYATMAETDLPDLEVAAMPHSYLVQLYIMTCAKLEESRARVAELENAIAQGGQQRDDESPRDGNVSA